MNASMTVAVSPVERELMLRLLEEALADLRVEVRHTDTPDYRDKLKEEQAVLEGLVDKVRAM